MRIRLRAHSASAPAQIKLYRADPYYYVIIIYFVILKDSSWLRQQIICLCLYGGREKYNHREISILPRKSSLFSVEDVLFAERYLRTIKYDLSYLKIYWKLQRKLEMYLYIGT